MNAAFPPPTAETFSRQVDQPSNRGKTPRWISSNVSDVRDCVSQRRFSLALALPSHLYMCDNQVLVPLSVVHPVILVHFIQLHYTDGNNCTFSWRVKVSIERLDPTTQSRTGASGKGVTGSSCLVLRSWPMNERASLTKLPVGISK